MSFISLWTRKRLLSLRITTSLAGLNRLLEDKKNSLETIGLLPCNSCKDKLGRDRHDRHPALVSSFYAESHVLLKDKRLSPDCLPLALAISRG